MQIADFVLFAAAIAGGVLGGMLFSWRLARRTKLIEWAMADLERVLTSEIKQRAAKARWAKKDELEEFMAANQGAAPQIEKPWWEKMRELYPKG